MSPSTDHVLEIAERLRLLYAERALAESAGLTANRRYVADLEREISGCREAFVGAAVTGIAVLRGELGGRAQG